MLTLTRVHSNICGLSKYSDHTKSMVRVFFVKRFIKKAVLAVIPAVHQSGKERTCSIQVITDHDAWKAIFPPEMFRKQGKKLWIGENQFGQNGLQLRIQITWERKWYRFKMGRYGLYRATWNWKFVCWKE